MGRPGFLKGVKNFINKAKNLTNKITKTVNSSTGRKVLKVVDGVGKGASKLGRFLETVIPGKYKLIGTGIQKVGEFVDKLIDDDTGAFSFLKDKPLKTTTKAVMTPVKAPSQYRDGNSKLKVLNPNHNKRPDNK